MDSIESIAVLVLNQISRGCAIFLISIIVFLVDWCVNLLASLLLCLQLTVPTHMYGRAACAWVTSVSNMETIGLQWWLIRRKKKMCVGIWRTSALLLSSSCRYNRFFSFFLSFMKCCCWRRQLHIHISRIIISAAKPVHTQIIQATILCVCVFVECAWCAGESQCHTRFDFASRYWFNWTVQLMRK